ncbi:roadblock/LC7 domain-containing protein [Actinomadura sp. NPDC048955]|uniref:roadblock/LC7 domain-containing protein n=1 Tax=Actinomadura TaxID=1988 RepID=UPI0021646506|nr:roadblock/LC7 domain-containing protein [Actinomadura glauciflava]MCR3743280.1 putative regulator of Ras-like GTPase activity, Roadblock/LC7/MglB family [Actinomadura glauciflava]
MTQPQHSGTEVPGGAGGELNWLLDSLVQRVAPVQNAVVLSSDGLRMAASSGLAREESDHLSAVAASFQSLARGAGESFGGGAVRQTIVEMESSFLFVTAAGRGACLAVLADAEADLGIIAYEMAMLVTRVGQHLSANPRVAAAEPGGA